MRRGCAVEIESFQRLHLSIFADGPCDQLDQLVSVGLHFMCLTLYLMEGHRIHTDFLYSFLHIPLSDLQNRTTIFENYYTNLPIRVLQYI